MSWRSTSGGTDGERSGRLAGRLPTVVAPCRQRGRRMPGFLSDSVRSRHLGQPAPSLLGLKTHPLTRLHQLPS